MATAFSSPSTRTSTLRHYPPELRRALRPSTHRSFRITMSTNTKLSYDASIEADIHTHVLNSLPTTPPPTVTESLRHLVSAAPMTLAAPLCVLACELVGGNKDDAMAAASALRLMHAASYTHGRLPALLGPGEVRQPSPFSLGIELMAGDGMLPLAYEVVARSGADAGRVLLVIKEMAEAMGGAEGREEGRLEACGAACGAILGGGGEEEVERLRRFGIYAGMMLRSGGRADQQLRSLAKSEVEGFEEARAAAILALLDRWCVRGEGMEEVMIHADWQQCV